MRVLVVDDSRTMRKIVRKALDGLQMESMEVIEASNGTEALQILRNERLEIDVVFLDWNMPQLDGIGFLKSLKTVAPDRDIPVIMVTSQSDRSHVAEALRWGARDYIIKPFVEQTLREKLTRLISQTEARKCAETSVMLQAIAGAATSDQAAPFLAELPRELVEEMKSRGRRIRYPSGSVVCAPGQAVDGLYVVLSGQVEIQETDGSTEILGEGHAVGEESFVSGKPLPQTVRAPSGAELLKLSRLALGELVRGHPKLSFTLSTLVTRRSTTRRMKEQGAGLAGKLETMPIAELAQVLHLCHKTGELKLTRPTGSASLFVKDGEIVHATCGISDGEDAVFLILGWNSAGFNFLSGVEPEKKTLTRPTMAVLMDGARRQDEARKAGPPLQPPATSPPAATRPDPSNVDPRSWT